MTSRKPQPKQARGTSSTGLRAAQQSNSAKPSFFWGATALLVLMTRAAYIPAYFAGFVWDEARRNLEKALATQSEAPQQSP